MKVKILSIMLLSAIFLGCTALDNPFKKKTSEMISFCNVDLTGNIELKRMTFSLPKIISELKPCQAGKIMHNLTRDHKVFFLDSLSFKNKIYTNNGSMDIRVKGDLNLLGNKFESPGEWLNIHEVMWKEEHRDDYPKHRKIQRITLEGLDCWKIYKKYYSAKNPGRMKSLSSAELIGRDIEYVCWDNKAKNYPPFKISAGVSYENNIPSFEFDLDSDILLPIFRTLKLKKLKQSEENRRIQEYHDRRIESCDRLIESSKNEMKHNKYHEIGVKQIQALNDCGYNTVKFRKWWCDKTIEVSKGDIKKSKYKDYTRGYFESIKECSK